MPEAASGRFAWRVFIAIGAIAALSVAIHFGGRMIGSALVTGGHTASADMLTMTVAGHFVSVPENVVRFKSQRRSGAQDRVDLYALYPEMSGYSEETKDWFNDKAAGRRLIFMSIEERQMSRDMSGRLDPIYAKLTKRSPKTGEAGLVSYEFLPSAGYSNEELLVGPEANDGSRYVVRCLAGEDSAIAVGACERDIHVGGNLSLTYRFPRSMLSDWRGVEAGVRAFALRIMGTPAG